MNNIELLYLLLPLSAFLYASVGHGGASSYIMLLALFGFSPEHIRPAALLMNIVVSLLAFINFKQEIDFPKKLFFILVLFSMPAAFLGGSILVDATLYKRMLGILLLFPIFRLLKLLPSNSTSKIKQSTWVIALVGFAIGFLSGLIGIGGGIILTPVLLMLGWAGLREAAAVSALFIFLNSLSGYFGAGAWSVQIPLHIWQLMPFTILAGAAGAYFGAKKFSMKVIRTTLICVLIFASLKLMNA